MNVQLAHLPKQSTEHALSTVQLATTLTIQQNIVWHCATRLITYGVIILLGNACQLVLSNLTIFRIITLGLVLRVARVGCILTHPLKCACLLLTVPTILWASLFRVDALIPVRLKCLLSWTRPLMFARKPVPLAFMLITRPCTVYLNALLLLISMPITIRPKAVYAYCSVR